MINKGVAYTGIPSEEELRTCPGVPSIERMKKGRVACIECVQEIPCNPCESSCKFGAIAVGSCITNLPNLDEEKCVGCGMYVASCPGLAITLLDLSYSEAEGTVDFPFEYLRRHFYQRNLLVLLQLNPLQTWTCSFYTAKCVLN